MKVPDGSVISIGVEGRFAESVIAPEEIRKPQVEIAAEATAERSRREASGEVEAIIARYDAEAEGVRKVFEAKPDGYREPIVACAENPQIAPTPETSFLR